MKTKKEKKKTTGDFKTQIKFLEFVGGKGYLNFLADEATIQAKYLVGLGMENTIFKLKIYSDGSVDCDEVDTKTTTKEQRQRLLQIVEDQTLSSYRNRTVINELPFMSVQKVKDKTAPLYLAVEYTKPIEKLGSLLDEEVDISEEAMTNLNDLLNSWFDDEDFVEEIEYTTEDPSGIDIYESSKRMNDYMSSLDNENERPIMEHHDINTNSLVKESFSKMKQEKLNELKSKKTQTENQIDKIGRQISSLEKSLMDAQNDLKLIQDRIDDIQPIDEPNGFYFFVSERCNETVELEPEMDKLIRDKVSKVKHINVENFMKLFTNGEYHISLSKVIEDGFEVIENFTDLPDDILNKLSSINLVLEDDKLVYSGDLAWGEIVNKMIKMGFLQNPDFDKECGSNSYSSKESSESLTTDK
jgi:hypothetical protein